MSFWGVFSSEYYLGILDHIGFERIGLISMRKIIPLRFVFSWCLLLSVFKIHGRRFVCHMFFSQRPNHVVRGLTGVL